VCPDCEPDEERDFNAVREVLQQSHDLNVEQVAEAAGVSTACVLRLVDEGRISSAVPGAVIPCGRCGAPAISASKKLCERCLMNLDRDFASALKTLNSHRKLRPQSSLNKTHDSFAGKRRKKIKPPPTKVK
jgi:hypothetical protein